MSRLSAVAVFAGSPDWTDREAIRRDLEILTEDSLVIECGGLGAARIAREEAQKLGLQVVAAPSLLDHHGPGADYKRNEAICRIEPGCLFAYPLGDPITEHMIRTAEANCIQVLVAA